MESLLLLPVLLTSVVFASGKRFLSDLKLCLLIFVVYFKRPKHVPARDTTPRCDNASCDPKPHLYLDTYGFPPVGDGKDSGAEISHPSSRSTFFSLLFGIERLNPNHSVHCPSCEQWSTNYYNLRVGKYNFMVTVL